MKKRPNLLFLFTDEQRFDTLAAYGNTKIEMPHINALAAQSHVFQRAYVTQAICTPARSSIMTGLFPHTNGLVDNNIPLSKDTRCLPELLPAGVYQSGYQGKWHLGDEIFCQHGFDQWVSIEDFYIDYYGKERETNQRSSYHRFLVDHGLSPKQGDVFKRSETVHIDESLSKPAFLAGEATRFLEQHQADPFVLYVNFLEPHMPFYSQRDEQYDPADVDLPENWNVTLKENQMPRSRLVQARQWANGFGGDELSNEAGMRKLIAKYWGLCSLVDTHVGTILQKVKDLGLWDDTIIVFTSDHGDMMGNFGMTTKANNFDPSIRVPLTLKLPGQTEGQIMEEPVSQIDLVPTLLDYLGAPLPDNLQGQSLRAEVENGKGTRDVFYEWNALTVGMGDIEEDPYPPYFEPVMTRAQARKAIADSTRTVVTPEGWKFNYSQQGFHELYNLRDDPLEMENLVEQADQKDRIHDLAGRIQAWQAQTQDSLTLPALT